MLGIFLGGFFGYSCCFGDGFCVCEMGDDWRLYLVFLICKFREGKWLEYGLWFFYF